MTKYNNEKRTVITLDAGGTNFVFSAIQGNKEIVEPITTPSNAQDLDLCLKTLVKGFEDVIALLNEKPVAISFAFPGPADYPNGIIIGELPNFPLFRQGVALKALLENHFNIPVFINNDGDLYAYGEALGGALPKINQTLKENGSSRQYKNLVGVTLGTGFGCGIVIDGRLLIGDNSNAAEIWAMSNRITPEKNAEEGVSTRGVINYYKTNCGETVSEDIMPFDIYKIAKGEVSGNKEVAAEAFRQMGLHLADALGNLLTLIDGVALIGGGITGAKELYMPAVLEGLRGKYTYDNKEVPRLNQDVYCLDNEEELKAFSQTEKLEIPVAFSDKTVTFEAQPRVAVMNSEIGASMAIALGAYAFALNAIDA